MARQPLKEVALGSTGMGKTFTCMKYVLETYSNPKNPNARKTLIYDSNLEFADVKPIKKEDIPLFVKQTQIEVRRVLPLDENGEELGIDEKYELLCDIVDNYCFKNGLLWLEDPNNYVTGANTKHFIKLLTTNRHKLLDIVIHLQTFKAVPPRIWGNLNVIRIHKTNDGPTTYSTVADQLGGNLEGVTIGHLLVDHICETNKHFYCIYNYLNQKITGQFTIPEFVEACTNYLRLNKKLVTTEALKSEITKEAAEKKLIIKLIGKYNGNVKIKSKEHGKP